MSVKERVDQWLAWDRNAETRREIEQLWAARDKKTLNNLLGSRMTFGTAGLRARMGAGNAQMNHLTIIQTAQGLAAYLAARFSREDLATRGIALGFDGRHHSNEFAQLTATVMRSSGIKTYLYDRVVPTPYVPFAIRFFRCVCGVMVTASHNPKHDNGYKVYWENGAQITAPHDKGIAAVILANLEPLPTSWELGVGDVNPFAEVHEAFMASLTQQYQPIGHAPVGNAREDVHFTYTAMHGVGEDFTLEALRRCGVPAAFVHSVPEQARPDPDFPTVDFPNPEEGKSSLNLAMRAAARTDSTVILANDPDADRLAVAVRASGGSVADDGGAWRIFNGNEIGALLGWWAVQHAKRRGDDPASCYLFSSTVSSPILDSIARKEGMHFQDTLTGFKWMGSLAEQTEREGKGKVLLAFEEAIGFMWGGRVYDKDGVTAAAVVADMARWVWAEEGLTLTQKLQQVYKEYGYHFSENSYVTAHDPKAVSALFKDIMAKETGSYPLTIAGAKVKHVRDLASGLDTRMPDRKARLQTSRSSPMLTFYLDNGVTLTVRGSGTEPKLKWYSCLVTSDPAGQAVLRGFVRAAVDELIQPERYGFQRRKGDMAVASAL